MNEALAERMDAHASYELAMGWAKGLRNSLSLSLLIHSLQWLNEL